MSRDLGLVRHIIVSPENYDNPVSRTALVQRLIDASGRGEPDDHAEYYDAGVTEFGYVIALAWGVRPFSYDPPPPSTRRHYIGHERGPQRS